MIRKLEKVQFNLNIQGKPWWSVILKEINSSENKDKPW